MTSSCTTYDTYFQHLQNEKQLYWKPWVGEAYKNIIGKKLLIVGESHYNTESADSNVEKSEDKASTRIMIHVSGLHGHGRAKDDKKKPLHRFIRNTEKALFNKPNSTLADSKMLWSAVSFYNFIQRPLHSQKHRPHQKDWQNGWDTFFKVVDILHPDYILFCGVSAFQRSFLDDAIKISGYSYDKKVREKEDRIKKTSVRTKGIISKDAHQSIITCIRHPSTSFSWVEWHRVIKKQMPELVLWLHSLS